MLIDSRINARRKAFTLIELLIVVAIIAILAAIAVPNFLEAQVRAKVSRVKNDMRTGATGLEAYAVDYGKYIPTSHAQIGGLTTEQIRARLGQQFDTEFGGNTDCYDYFDRLRSRSYHAGCVLEQHQPSQPLSGSKRVV